MPGVEAGKPIRVPGKGGHIHDQTDAAGKLDGESVGSRERLPATVPGSVYADLLNNGKLEDPIGGTMSLPP